MAQTLDAAIENVVFLARVNNPAGCTIKLDNNMFSNRTAKSKNHPTSANVKPAAMESSTIINTNFQSM